MPDDALYDVSSLSARLYTAQVHCMHKADLVMCVSFFSPLILMLNFITLLYDLHFTDNHGSFYSLRFSANHFNIFPVFPDHKSKSSSSILIPIFSENCFNLFSISRYSFLFFGLMLVSRTPNSCNELIMCLSRIAYPLNPIFLRK